MRSYVRHPAEIPIRIEVQAPAMQGLTRKLSNISHGGLAFVSEQPLRRGTQLRVCIDAVKPAFQTCAIVTHCQQEDDNYLIGIEFRSRRDSYVARMVEQVCHIEQYRRRAAERDGRVLTTEQAAQEWIARYAATFPQWTA